MQGQQALGNTAVGMLGQVTNAYQNPMDTSGLPGIASNVANSGNISTSFQNQGPGLQGSLNTAGNPSLMGQLDNSHNPQLQSQLNTSGNPALLGSVDTSGAGHVQNQINGGQTWQDAVQQAQNAAYGSQTQYLDPQFQQSHEALDNQLANQGITRGSEAYDTAQKNLGLQQQQAYSNAQMNAVQAGNQEQNTLFGQGLQQGNFTNSAQQQAYNQLFNNAGFQNNANQQAFGQTLAGGQFGNQAANDAYQQLFNSGQFQNQANQQAFGQSAAQGQFNNQANAQGYQQGMGTAAFNNDAQSQLFGQNTTNANLQNSANAQALQQMMALRNQPLNEYNALATGAQVQTPTFGSYAQAPVATTNVAGITNDAYQQQLAAYQQQMQGINNLYSLGGSALGAAAQAAPFMSDRRVKHDISRIGTTPGGLPVYTFRYNFEPETLRTGVMADEVLPLYPEAVSTHESGYAMVDYARIK